MRRAFTLIEVNLAMLIMAGGILSIVGLYAFGFRENRQSREDVAATAYADAVISPLMMAISATNVTWTDFRKPFYYPNKEGWGAYLNDDGIVDQNLAANESSKAFDAVLGWAKPKPEADYKPKSSYWSNVQPKLGNKQMVCAVVVMHEQDSAVATIGFRAVEKDSVKTLLSMPLFYTEVRFQGVVE